MKSKQEALITKWAPVNILDIRRTETWLEHMAARGLIYHRQSSWNTLLGEFFCTVPHLFLAQFQKKEPQISRRYRLVPAPKNQRPSPEQLELYAHSGWQYVDFIDLFYASFLLFFSDDPGALEPYTDPDSFRLAYRFPVRGLAVVLLLFVGFDVLYQVLDFVGGGSASSDGLPALLTAWGGTICQILALLFALSVLVNFFLDLRAIRLIQQQIQQMQAARPTLPDRLFPAQKALTLASGALFLADLALSAVLIVLLVVQLPRTDVPLSKLETDFDLLTLEEMDGDNGWTPSRDLEAGRIHVRFNVADIYNHPSQQIEKQYTSTSAAPAPADVPSWRPITISQRAPRPPKTCWTTWFRTSRALRTTGIPIFQTSRFSRLRSFRARRNSWSAGKEKTGMWSPWRGTGCWPCGTPARWT